MESEVTDFVEEGVADLLWVIVSHDTLVFSVDVREAKIISYPESDECMTNTAG